MSTIDTIGDQQTLDKLVSGSITSYVDDHIQSICAMAFAYCEDLKNVELSNLSLLNSNAFSECSSLVEVLFGQQLPHLASNAFYNDMQLQLITCPSDSFGNTGFSSALEKSGLATSNGKVFIKKERLDTSNFDSYKPVFNLIPYEDYPNDSTIITDTWEEIIAAENDGTYISKYKLYDVKRVQFQNDNYDFQIIAFDTDDLADGTGKAHITWLAKHLFLASTFVQSGNDNSEGWAGSFVRSKLAQKFTYCDESFKQAVKPVIKTYKVYPSGVATTLEVTDNMWIPSLYEITGNTGFENSGVRYTALAPNPTASYGKSAYTNDTGLAAEYWTRTAYSAAMEYTIGTTGSTSSFRSVNNNIRVRIGFCT